MRIFKESDNLINFWRIATKIDFSKQSYSWFCFSETCIFRKYRKHLYLTYEYLFQVL